MYIKLALRNLRRSARDYGIYFLTVAVTVALMESFLALACARDVLSLSENMGILTTGIVGVSVLVALLSSCVIAYGVGFMLGQRKQEFALYQLMGMELRTVQRMFFWENGLLGLAAFGLGALLGTGLAGVLAQGVWWIFQTPHQYQVVASPKALGMTFLLFLLMYGVGALRAGRVLNENGIFVTILHSTGGFLRKRSVTIMIGVEEAKLEQVLDLLKETAGRRTVTLYQNPGSMPPPHGLPPLFASTPMEVCQGGVAVFVLDLERLEKY